MCAIASTSSKFSQSACQMSACVWITQAWLKWCAPAGRGCDLPHRSIYARNGIFEVASGGVDAESGIFGLVNSHSYVAIFDGRRLPITTMPVMLLTVMMMRCLGTDG